MTYIEFFDKEPCENVIACLSLAPERVIFIGENSKVMKRHIENYRRVFSERGENIEFLYRVVPKNSKNDAVELISEIVNTYEDCVFDITGGQGVLILALGIVYERNPDKNIQITKYNPRTNAVYDCDDGEDSKQTASPSLTVEEVVRIHGGDILYGDAEDEGKTYLWELDEEFVTDTELMWYCCKQDVRLWNTQIGVFEAIFKSGRLSDGGLTAEAAIAAVNFYLQRFNSSYKVFDEIKKFLIKYGLITLYDDKDGKNVKLSFKNKQVKKCLTKAGMALEMKVFVTAGGLADGEDYIYNDVLNGAVIDWDGEYHDEADEELYDTENEIDVILMHGVVPVFISCKNGVLTSDELYKLNTVANRFGGKYAKKVLVTTAISSLGEAGKYIRQRAGDMKIRIIDDIHTLSDEEIEKKLRTLWQS